MIELTLLSKRKAIKSNENYGTQSAMKILNSPGRFAFGLEMKTNLSTLGVEYD
jgi:hypothetical protein